MLASILNSMIFACSGPGAIELINRNFWESVLLAAIAAAFVALTWLIYFRLSGKVSMLLVFICTLTFAIHPAWSISALVGDCGMVKLAESKRFTGIIALTFIFQLGWWLWKRKNQLTNNPA